MSKKISKFRRRLMTMSKEEKQEGFDNFVKETKELNLNRNEELKSLNRIRGVE